MSKKQKLISTTIFAVLIIFILVGIFLTNPVKTETEPINEVMRDSVLHEGAKIKFFGGFSVNPALISAYSVTAIMLIIAVLIRIFAIPKFRIIPGKFQLILEQAVGIFDGIAREKSPHRNKFLAAYIFTAGSYIFIGTLFELLGIQAITTRGQPISLPAPLSDINAALALGVMSYGVILIGGLIAGGFGGFFTALKDFSLPVSMSFRLFGALLSGALVTELVYYYYSLSFVLPVIVGVMFTLLHAVIQAYVLAMLTAQFYGESTEKTKKGVK
ncbi:MAG: F0F1 ATP synthase subunit A [Firmicutes bacterium]|nr:F0F1 ATP synthase subunit A [Bacillota bacterium]